MKVSLAVIQPGMSLIPTVVGAESVRAMALLGALVFVVAMGYGAGLPLI